MNDATELSIKSYDAGFERGWVEATADYEKRLRDDFARAALHGLVAHHGNGDEYSVAASIAYQMAEAMLQERKNYV